MILKNAMQNSNGLIADEFHKLRRIRKKSLFKNFQNKFSMKFIPIKFHVFYISFTLLFSFFGPKVYLNYDKLSVLFFMTIYLLVISVGFYIGVTSKIIYSSVIQLRSDRVLNFLKFCIVSSVILSLINLSYLYFNGRLNIDISSIGANYTEFYDYYIEKTRSSLFTFEILFLVASAVPKFISLALGFIYFKKLTRLYKNLFILYIILIIVTQTISLGNQKSIGDLVIFGLIALVVALKDASKSKRRKLVRKSITIIVFLLILLSYTQYSRLDSRGISAIDINEHMAEYSYFNLDHFIFKIFGYKIGLGISTFISGYLSGGYYGLSLCMHMPFDWSYGIGNSVTLTSLIERIFSVEIYSNTYLFRMEQTYGVLGKQQWHTIFPWLASDFTFPGTLLIFFPISYFYGKSWNEVLRNGNPVSMLLFSLLSILFIFVPANNQILHGFDYFVVTSFVIIYWLNAHKKYNSPHRNKPSVWQNTINKV